MGKSVWVIITLILILVAGYFYWFQWRPSQIRKDCAEKYPTNLGMKSDIDKAKTNYDHCLHEKGLK